MARYIVTVWIDPDQRDHPFGPFEEPSAKAGLSAKIHGEIYSGYLAVGKSTIRPGISTRTEYLIGDDTILMPGSTFELLDGARSVGRAEVVKRIT